MTNLEWASRWWKDFPDIFWFIGSVLVALFFISILNYYFGLGETSDKIKRIAPKEEPSKVNREGKLKRIIDMMDPVEDEKTNG